jgi:hypothetical protein
MTDILDYEYAALLLTAQEHDGAFAPPPAPLALATADRPRWLDVGGARAFHEAAAPYAKKMFAAPPCADLAENRAIALVPRATDPNAGKGPQDEHTGRNAPTGYQPFYYYAGGVRSRDNFRLHDWGKDHAPNHLGGTMRPCQAVPEMEPVLHRVRGILWRLQFRRRQRAARFWGYEVRLGVRVITSPASARSPRTPPSVRRSGPPRNHRAHRRRH